MSRRLALFLTAAVAALALGGCGSFGDGSTSAQRGGSSGAWAGCSSYATSAGAQDAWKAAGRPAQADGDGDGRVCESLSSGTAAKAKRTGCTTPSRPVAIGLSRTRYPRTLEHASDAIAKGAPRILVLNREGAERRRSRLLAGYDTRDGYDLDEYPPAVGRRVVDANVRLVPSADNRGSGSVMGTKLRRFCDGTRFYLQGY